MLKLSDAISAAETASSAYVSAAGTTQSDQDLADGIETKLDAARAKVADDKTAQDAAAKQFNASLQDLIDAATGAMILTGAPTNGGTGIVLQQ